MVNRLVGIVRRFISSIERLNFLERLNFCGSQAKQWSACLQVEGDLIARHLTVDDGFPSIVA